MTAILQISASVGDWARLRASIEWLRSEVPHPEGFVSLRVLRDESAPERFTLLEEWTDQESFYRALHEFGPAAREEFLERVGLPRSAFSTLGDHRHRGCSSSARRRHA